MYSYRKRTIHLHCGNDVTQMSPQIQLTLSTNWVLTVEPESSAATKMTMATVVFSPYFLSS